MPTGRLERADGRLLGGENRAGNGTLVPDIPVRRAQAGSEKPSETDPLVRGDAILSEAVRQLRVVLKAF
jgi:hypothetical protein